MNCNISKLNEILKEKDQLRTILCQILTSSRQFFREEKEYCRAGSMACTESQQVSFISLRPSGVAGRNICTRFLHIYDWIRRSMRKRANPAVFLLEREQHKRFRPLLRVLQMERQPSF